MANPRELSDRFNEAFNRHDLDALVAMTAPDSEFKAPGKQVFRGGEGSRAFNSVWFDAFPDSKTTVTRRFIEGNTVIEEGIFEGTHTGTMKSPMGNVPATGRTLKGEYCAIQEWTSEGLAGDGSIYYDVADIMIQLGLMPEPASV